MNLTWKTQKGQYQNGEDLYAGKIRLASFGWNSGISRSAPEDERKAKQYVGSINLPGLDATLYAPDIDSMKLKIALRVNQWFAEVNK